MKIKYLPDELILRLATKDGRVGYVTTWKDLSFPEGLTVNNIRPYPGGVYDKSIFGSIMPKGSSFKNFSRYGCIEMPIRYCMEIHKPALLKYITSLGVVLSDAYHQNQYVGIRDFVKSSGAKEASKRLDYTQFNVVDNKIVATDDITDSTKCSYDGLIQALHDIGRHDAAEKIENLFTNRYVLVLPISCRKFSVMVNNGEAVPNNNLLTQQYRYLLFAIEVYNKVISQPRFSDDTEQANAELVLLEYKLRCIANSIGQTDPLFKGGHDNFSRSMQKNRLKGSMRAVIVPDPTLKIDEVGLPIHLAYEMCDKEFIEYLMDNFGWSKPQAIVKFKKPYEGHMLDIFSHYIDGTKPKVDDEGKVPAKFEDIEWIEDELGPKYAIIDRQPTLHQISMLSCRVKLTCDNAIKYSLLLCSPLNADFDGDTIAVFAVNKSMSPTVNNNMDPKNLIYWTENNKPLFIPSHDQMMGNIIMTKMSTNPDEEVKPFENIEAAKKALMSDFRKRPSERQYRFNTQVNIGDEDEMRITTIGRAILSTLYDDDPYFLENMLRTNEATQLNSDLVADLILHLTQYMNNVTHTGMDREQRIKDIQYWTLMAATKSGSTAPKLSQLYLGVNEEMIKRIRDIENDEALDQDTKSIRIASIYSEYVDRKRAKGLSDEVVTQVKESSRAKESQLVEMTCPMLTVDPDHNTHVTRTTFIQGMAFDDYTDTVISNRGVQAIKHSSTPTSGYLTRQLLYSCNNWYLDATQDDPENEGIMLPAELADRRTKVDGSIYEYSKDDKGKFVKVRSIITSTKPRFIVTPDMINSKYHAHFKDGYQIGASFSTSLTQGVTQAALGLKHGAVLQDYDRGKLSSTNPSKAELKKETDHGTFLFAPEDCELTIDDNFIILTGNTGVYKYPKPSKYSLVSAKSNFEDGELISIIPEQFTPGIACDSIIRFIGAAGTRVNLKYQRNLIRTSDCYCVKEGVIHYRPVKIKHKGNEFDSIEVTIGDIKYEYNPSCFYFIPDGTQVKAGEKFCSGMADMSYVFRHGVNDISLFYSIFYNQISKFVPGISTEILEFVYTVIYTDFDEQSNTHMNVSRSLDEVLTKDGGTYQRIAKKSPKKFLEDIDPFEGEQFSIDEMATRMLMTLINRSKG